MSLFDFQDVCMVIGSLATLDLPMVVDLIGIFELKGSYCMLIMADWFLQTLSVIPRGSSGDVSRCFTMIRWLYFSPPPFPHRRRAATVADAAFRRCFDRLGEEIPFMVVYTDNIEEITSNAHEDREVSTQAGPQHISLPIMDNTANELTSLQDRVSSLDLKVERMRDDTNLKRNHIVQLRRQLETSVDGLEIKMDVLESTLGEGPSKKGEGPSSKKGEGTSSKKRRWF
ncbi:myosin heavy chain, skeletal muscle [Dorcoceras hygrometricum]|uniref:Myosin heavy chain, skeletal muscle n=1 Tax=Dorcoceras hygrometricum TaxID=472368 RepID=A0A2Z7B776_9LAMI|nr:myosin heavy chain, skeletal muscle [Dorcoceras hygrometricum]